MLSKNPPATNAVLQPVSCNVNATDNYTANTVDTLQYIIDRFFYLHTTSATHNSVFVENITVQGFAWMYGIGDKWAEDKMGEEKFKKGNLYGKSIKGTSLTINKAKSPHVLTTNATVSEVECKHILSVTAINFFYKNQQKNLLEMNTVVIGKNTS